MNADMKFIVRGTDLDRRYTILKTSPWNARVRVEDGRVTASGRFQTLRQKTITYSLEKIEEIYTRRQK